MCFGPQHEKTKRQEGKKHQACDSALSLAQQTKATLFIVLILPEHEFLFWCQFFSLSTRREQLSEMSRTCWFLGQISCLFCFDVYLQVVTIRSLGKSFPSPYQIATGKRRQFFWTLFSWQLPDFVLYIKLKTYLINGKTGGACFIRIWIIWIPGLIKVLCKLNLCCVNLPPPQIPNLPNSQDFHFFFFFEKSGKSSIYFCIWAQRENKLQPQPQPQHQLTFPSWFQNLPANHFCKVVRFLERVSSK